MMSKYFPFLVFSTCGVWIFDMKCSLKIKIGCLSTWIISLCLSSFWSFTSCNYFLNIFLLYWETRRPSYVRRAMMQCFVIIFSHLKPSSFSRLAVLETNSAHSFVWCLYFVSFVIIFFVFCYSCLLILDSWFLHLDQSIREGQRCYCSGTSNCSPWGITTTIIFYCKCPKQFSQWLQGDFLSVMCFH